MSRSKSVSAPEAEAEVKSSLAALAEAARGETAGQPLPGWTLPSGEDLLDYALKGGFLAPSILGTDAGNEVLGRESRGSKGKQ